MQVETYEIEDVKHSDASTMALDAEAAELIERLGLEGQKSLQNPETLTRCPYPVAEEDAITLFRALNPETCPPEKYSLDPIPVRVLQVLEHAKSLKFFTSFQIWYPRSARIDDPVLVAFRTYRRDGQSWDTTDTHVLARWGKMLRPMNELRKEAIENLRETVCGKLEEMKAEIETAQRTAKTTPSLKWLAGHFYVSTP